MAEKYRHERNKIIERFYGTGPTKVSMPERKSTELTLVCPEDGYGIPAPVNSPFPIFGHCMAWRHTLNNGYGTLKVDGEKQTAHRAAYQQTRGSIPKGKQINHLCNRPYCFQPSHLYAGDQQDNSDDGTLFRSDEMSYPWAEANYFEFKSEDPLTNRLRETKRYDDTEPWLPVEQPVKPRLEPFRCDQHDFAVRMPGSPDRICRICETTPMAEEIKTGHAPGFIIAELWPISQASPEIFNQFSQSDINKEDLVQRLRDATARIGFLITRGPHSIQSCQCYQCKNDRRIFWAAVQPNLTEELETAISICEKLRPTIQRSISKAIEIAMRQLTEENQLDPDQQAILLAHTKDCCDDYEFRQTAATTERVIGAATHCLMAGTPTDEIMQQEWAQHIRIKLNTIRIQPNEDIHYVEKIGAQARRQADQLIDQWVSQIRPLVSEKHLEEESTEIAATLTRMSLTLTLFELIRYQVKGHNSSTSTFPPPHDGCIQTIKETGKWTPQPPMQPFTEGGGYNPQNDPFRPENAPNL